MSERGLIENSHVDILALYSVAFITIRANTHHTYHLLSPACTLPHLEPGLIDLKLTLACERVRDMNMIEKPSISQSLSADISPCFAVILYMSIIE